MKNHLSFIQKMSIFALLWAKKATFLLIALILVNAVIAQNVISSKTVFSTQKPIRDKHGLSEKMRTQIQTPVKSEISVRSGATDLGNGMSLLGNNVDANST